jgi:hypothetical protein
VTYGTLKDFDLWITTTGISAKRIAAYRKLTTVREISESTASDPPREKTELRSC